MLCYCDLFQWNVKHVTVFSSFHHKSLFAYLNSPQNPHTFLSWKLIYVLSDCSKLWWLWAGPQLAAVALRGVRGAVPRDALCQHLPLLRHDLLLLQDRGGGGARGQGAQCVHCPGLWPLQVLVRKPVRQQVQPRPPGHPASVGCWPRAASGSWPPRHSCPRPAQPPAHLHQPPDQVYILQLQTRYHGRSAILIGVGRDVLQCLKSGKFLSSMLMGLLFTQDPEMGSTMAAWTASPMALTMAVPSTMACPLGPGRPRLSTRPRLRGHARQTGRRGHGARATERARLVSLTSPQTSTASTPDRPRSPAATGWPWGHAWVTCNITCHKQGHVSVLSPHAPESLRDNVSCTTRSDGKWKQCSVIKRSNIFKAVHFWIHLLLFEPSNHSLLLKE